MLTLTPNLKVNNVKETIAFYKILGFEPVMKIPEKEPFWWALLQSKKNITIMVQEKESFENEYPHLKNFMGGSFSLYIKVSQLENLFKKIKDKVKVIKKPHITSYQMQEFAIEDCNGYLLVFAEEK